MNSFIDSDGSDAALSDNGDLFRGNESSGTSQDDYLHQNNGPQIDIEDDLLPGGDPEDHSFDTDDPEDDMHPGVNDHVPDLACLG